ncbi:hypothetical protein D3C76_599840 [compost metagenome]
MNIRERMASLQLFTDHDANYPEEAAELARARHGVPCNVIRPITEEDSCFGYEDY